jgi:hypothetical protein
MAAGESARRNGDRVDGRTGREPRRSRQVLRGSQRFFGMGDELVGYFSRIVMGLVACAVVAVTLHAQVAAGAILAAVMVLALALTCLIVRDAL